MAINRFNLRVYGLLVNQDRVLITHENRGMLMTKFPGGGLELGEGIKDCLIREFKEELDIRIELGEFFYVNDFLQVSTFKESDQLISFYYFVGTDELNKIPISSFDPDLKPEMQLFEWVSIKDLNLVDFTFPIDKRVVEKLSQSF